MAEIDCRSDLWFADYFRLLHGASSLIPSGEATLMLHCNLDEFYILLSKTVRPSFLGHLLSRL